MSCFLICWQGANDFNDILVIHVWADAIRHYILFL